MRRLVAILFFLMFVNEGSTSQTYYANQMFAPFAWVDNLFEPLPIKIRPFDLILLVVAVTAGARGGLVAPMRSLLFVAMGTTIFFLLLGATRGGDTRAGMWQIYLMLASPLAALAVAGTHTKIAHYRLLAKTVVAAAIYRAIMCVTYYLVYVRGADAPAPACITTHNDTVLWVVAMGILIVNFLEARTTMAKVGAYVAFPLIVVAVHFNNRRLAWVSLAASLLSLYFLLPPSAPKRRLKKVAMIFAPVLAVYVVVGWGRPEKIFKPIASISSVSSKPDSSTLARNVENLSLIRTASFTPATGTGWGHKYIELSNKYTIEGTMELWPYIPHNSILGLFAYTGFLGLLGFWLIFPTAVFLHARIARLAKDPHSRSVGLVAVMATATCLNQLFGDMGIFSWATMYTMAAVWGAAMRVPIEAGVWPAPTSAKFAGAAKSANSVGTAAAVKRAPADAMNPPA